MLNTDRFTIDGKHINRDAADKAMAELRDKLSPQQKHPHRPVRRDENGNWVLSLREELMSSPPVTLSNVLTSISDKFMQLIQLLGNIRL